MSCSHSSDQFSMAISMSDYSTSHKQIVREPTQYVDASLHKLISIDSGSYQVAPWSEILTSVPEHHVCLCVALERVMKRELDAGEVEPSSWVLVLVTKSSLWE